MSRKTKVTIEPNFAKHPEGECSFCDIDCLQLCAAFQMFAYSGGTADSWRILRNFMVPGTGRFMPATVWQLVLSEGGITDLRGGKYCDGGEVPTPEQVALAIALGSVSSADAS